MARNASLYFKEGNSDKVYFCDVSASGGGFVVNFSFGRRGSALQSGTKTPNGPVDEAAAIKIFDKLVKEKTGKGYKPMEGTSTTTEAADGPAVERIIVTKTAQLPVAIEEDAALRLLIDDAYLMQEKMDGHHKTTACEDGKCTTANKKGQEVETPSILAKIMRNIDSSGSRCVIDYEHIGDEFHAFDLLAVGGRDLTSLSYEQRYTLLERIVPKTGNLKLVRAAITSVAKRQLWDEIKKAGGEGVVFKQRSAPFSVGKSAGTMVKFKFCAMLSAKVSSVTAGKRSVMLSLFDAGNEIQVGKVTIPPNHDIPAVGTVVEVRYLYAYRGGALFQTVYLGPRDDVDISECLTSQVKYKQEGE